MNLIFDKDVIEINIHGLGSGDIVEIVPVCALIKLETSVKLSEFLNDNNV